MFDPEKVERRLISGDYDESWRPDLTEAEGWGTAEEAYRHSVVSTEDYDQLLALYRELQSQMVQGMNDSRAASTVNSILKWK